MRPIGNRILIRPSKASEKSAGGIVTPEQYRQRDVVWDGEVIGLGSGTPTKNGNTISFEVGLGQRVLVNRYSVVIVPGDEELWLAKQEDILAVITNTSIPNPDWVDAPYRMEFGNGKSINTGPAPKYA